MLAVMMMMTIDVVQDHAIVLGFAIVHLLLHRVNVTLVLNGCCCVT